MNSIEELVSIVVPIYKVEDYLDECVHSLIHQTYNNIEIVLVDDGSPDLCGTMIDRYASEERRIVAVHKENGGLSSARNEGMKYAHGKYIAFVDSDDIVAPNYIERLLQIILDKKCSIAVCDFERFASEMPTELGIEKDIQLFSKEEAIIEMFRNNSIGWNAWNKLYLKELFKDIEYPVGMICEDKATTYKLVLASSKVGYTHEKLYYYRVRETSISGQHSKQYCFDSIEINNQIEKDLSYQKNHSLLLNAKAYSSKCAFRLYADAYRRKDYVDVMEVCKHELKTKYTYIFNAKFLNFAQKIIVYLAGVSANHKCILLKLFSRLLYIVL